MYLYIDVLAWRLLRSSYNDNKYKIFILRSYDCMLNYIYYKILRSVLYNISSMETKLSYIRKSLFSQMRLTVILCV